MADLAPLPDPVDLQDPAHTPGPAGPDDLSGIPDLAGTPDPAGTHTLPAAAVDGGPDLVVDRSIRVRAAEMQNTRA